MKKTLRPAGVTPPPVAPKRCLRSRSRPGARHDACSSRDSFDERILRRIIDDGPIAFFLWRIEPGVWPIEMVTDNIVRLLGYSAEDLMSGRVTWPAITHPDDDPRLEAEVARHLRSQATEWTQCYRLITRSGEVRWFQDWNRTLCNSCGDVTHVQAMLMDITEQVALQRQILDLSERERRRVGQDLHDSIGQSINGIRYLVNAAQQTLQISPAGVAAELQRISDLVGQTADQVHDLARGLSPGDLGDGNMAMALRALAEQTQTVFGIRCRFIGGHHADRLDASTAGQFYRIAQEAINNAAKHSQANTIRMRLTSKNRGLVLSVHDDGTGLCRSTSKSNGMGQRIMRYRAEMIGATLDVQSLPGKGTTVTCMLPANRLRNM